MGARGYPAMRPEEILERAGEVLSVKRVFGEPYQLDGATIVPVAPGVGRGRGGCGGRGGADSESGGGREEGGGGGLHMRASPAGVFVIRAGEVRWEPVVDVTRLALAGMTTAVVSLLVLRSTFRQRRRRRAAP